MTSEESILRIIIYSLTYPGYSSLIVFGLSQDYKYVVKSMIALTKPVADYNPRERCIVFNNGSFIKLDYQTDEDVRKKMLTSCEFNSVRFYKDAEVHFTSEQITYIKSRARRRKNGK